jgi:anti-sigma-K factor RskA
MSAQVFSRTDLVMDSERFYNTIIELLNDPEEKEEVNQLILWWNRQIFPLYTENEQLPSKNSVLARIHVKWAEHQATASDTATSNT